MTYLEKLVRHLMVAVLYFREQEIIVEQNVDFTPSSVEHPGGVLTLESTVERYIGDRVLDTKRPDAANSSFLLDVGTLATAIARPGGIFVADARRTAFGVTERVLLLEGWRLKDFDELELWQQAFTDVEPQLPASNNEYAKQIARFWRFQNIPSTDAFDEVRAWWNENYAQGEDSSLDSWTQKS